MAEVAVRESAIDGLGVFALEPIRGGQVVRRFEIEREVTPDAPLRPERGERPEHCPCVDGRFLLVASPDRYLNHSCDPNAWLRFGEGGIHVVARRGVAAGEELTVDYLINNAGGDSWRCHCGAARCRGETGISFFTLPPDVQREYLPLLAPWFAERHARELGPLTPR